MLQLLVFAFMLTSQLQAQDVTLKQEVQQVYKAIVRIEVVSESGSGGRMKKSSLTWSGQILRFILCATLITLKQKVVWAIFA